MLFISRLTLIDVAEAQDSWQARVRRQWKWGPRSLLAVRVRDEKSIVLGSTVPKPLVHLHGSSTAAPAWGTAWALREPPPPLPPTRPAPSVADDVVLPTNTTTNTAIINTQEDTPARELTAAAQENEEAARGEGAQTATAHREGDAKDTITTAATDVSSHGAEAVDGAAAARTAEPAPPRDDGAVEPLPIDTEPPDTPPAPPSPAHERAAAREAVHESEEDTRKKEEGQLQEEEEEKEGDGVVIELTGHTAQGTLTFEVLTLMGELVATAVVDVGAAFAPGADAAVHPFAVLLTPCNVRSVGPDTVYALLEFAVMRTPHHTNTKRAEAQDEGEAERTAEDRAVAYVPSAHMHGALRALRETPMPLAARYDCVALSTTHLYYPACFLTEVGTYIVSNVLCLENVCEHALRLEFVVTGDSSTFSFVPSSVVTLSEPRERAYVVCTWNMFRPLVPHGKGAAHNHHRGREPALGIHLLVHEEEVSRPSIDISLHHDAPQADEATGQYAPFCFFVNRTMVSNVPCSSAELALVRPLLPIYAVAVDEIDEAPPGESQLT